MQSSSLRAAALPRVPVLPCPYHAGLCSEIRPPASLPEIILSNRLDLTKPRIPSPALAAQGSTIQACHRWSRVPVTLLTIELHHSARLPNRSEHRKPPERNSVARLPCQFDPDRSCAGPDYLRPGCRTNDGLSPECRRSPRHSSKHHGCRCLDPHEIPSRSIDYDNWTRLPI